MMLSNFVSPGWHHVSCDAAMSIAVHVFVRSSLGAGGAAGSVAGSLESPARGAYLLVEHAKGRIAWGVSVAKGRISDAKGRIAWGVSLAACERAHRMGRNSDGLWVLRPFGIAWGF